MERSQITIDLGALDANVRHLRALARGADLYAVVKANAYGHGLADVARTAVAAGAAALCVATVREGAAVRRLLPDTRIIVLTPCVGEDLRVARAARLEVVVSAGPIPDGLPVHLKLETGLGRWGAAELPARHRSVVGVMTHLATARSDRRCAEEQLVRFRAAVAPLGFGHDLTVHAANSAATLSLPGAHLDAVRCGLALYGVSPFDRDPARDGLRPVLRWSSFLHEVRWLPPGGTSGYNRALTAGDHGAWLGLVPVGHADGVLRGSVGTRLLVGDEPCPIVGSVSMDALTVRLPRPLSAGTPVQIVGADVRVDEHAVAAGTTSYEWLPRIDASPLRARRTVVGAQADRDRTGRHAPRDAGAVGA